MAEESGTYARVSGSADNGPREWGRVEDRTLRERTAEWRFPEQGQLEKEPSATDEDMVGEE
ncbi:hypothetical protein FHR84_000875 [Actinopolyspora biskrensis]|uniref:Uncharacterized protein n=1 Tax=Actinopolyspora biskrensis TaxID=1470178 RepID=A0A852YS65_9ACTN|nr:hypothetical protein [Actinopolyspora biskrensis]NYH77561.1 hypothetical protein [Actinopolyspora biskrensis]